MNNPVDESGEGSGFGMTADTITAIKKAFPNMFRPLEWHHFDGETEHGHGEWWAHGSRGMFHIYDVREKFPDDRPFYAKELSDQLDTLEMAQEAFQKWHEMDIVMCLDPGFLSTLESLQRENEEGRELARAFEAEANQLREVSIANRHRAERAEAELKRLEEWRPISEADNSIVHIFDVAGLSIANSLPIWARDANGRVYEALWSDDGRRAYWWDIEGESPVDPVEFMPHPLSRTALSSTGDTHGN